MMAGPRIARPSRSARRDTQSIRSGPNGTMAVTNPARYPNEAGPR